MFRLYFLSIDTLFKIRQVKNKIISGQERNGRHFNNDAFFDIQSMANQLYCSQSIVLEGLKSEKIYFFENLASNLLIKSIKQLYILVWAFHKSLYKTSLGHYGDFETRARKDNPIILDPKANKKVNKLFSLTWNRETLADVFI